MQQAAGLMLGDGTHEQIHAAIQPAVERFNSLEVEDQDMFRDALTRFVRVYGFLAQVVKFTNVGLERDYIYCRALAALIRDKNPGDSIDLGSEVELTHLRHDKIFEGSISLPDGEGEVQTIYSGTGPLADPDEEHLSAIISRINRTVRYRLDRRRPSGVRSRRRRPRQQRRDPKPSHQQRRTHLPRSRLCRPVPKKR